MLDDLRIKVLSIIDDISMDGTFKIIDAEDILDKLDESEQMDKVKLSVIMKEFQELEVIKVKYFTPEQYCVSALPRARIAIEQAEDEKQRQEEKLRQEEVIETVATQVAQQVVQQAQQAAAQAAQQAAESTGDDDENEPREKSGDDTAPTAFNPLIGLVAPPAPPKKVIVKPKKQKKNVGAFFVGFVGSAFGGGVVMAVYILLHYFGVI